MVKTSLSRLLPCRVLKRQSISCKRQNLESIQEKWNGDLPRDIAKDAKGQDLSKNTAYIVGQINIDLETPLSLMP